MAQRNGGSAPCKGCGALIHRSAAKAAIRSYCDLRCRPLCAVDGCEEPEHARGWCSFHYTRWNLAGDPLAPTTRRRPSDRGVCAYGPCDLPQRSRDWCAAHYAQWRAGAELRPIRKLRDTCLACGGPTGSTWGYRKFCGTACKTLWYKSGGVLPPTYTCVLCGSEESMTHKNGRRRHSDVKYCEQCAGSRHQHGSSIRALAVRDGIDCGICHMPVNLALLWPDPTSPSVDHVIPRARGGSDDPSNLQLAHLTCNCRKRHSMP